MTDLTLRSIKGSLLTASEVDQNFINVSNGIFTVYNYSGETAPAFSIVAIGHYSDDNNLGFNYTQADAFNNVIIGLTLESIIANASGKVATKGLISGINTSSFGVGDTLYISNLNAFSWLPLQGASSLSLNSDLYLYIGVVITVDTVGKIYLDPSRSPLAKNGVNIEKSRLLLPNNSGSTIPAHSFVYYDEISNGIKLAQANNITTCRVLGYTQFDILNSELGYIINFESLEYFGDVTGIDPQIQDVWLSPSSAGNPTFIKPSLPNFAVKLGTIYDSSSINTFHLKIEQYDPKDNGGSTDQVLTKNSSSDKDYSWKTALSIYVGTTAPSSPIEGQFWFDIS
jgi:hypothetical protein